MQPFTKTDLFSGKSNLFTARVGISLLGGFGFNIGRIKYNPKSKYLSDTSIGFSGFLPMSVAAHDLRPALGFFYVQIPKQVWIKPMGKHGFWGAGFSTGFLRLFSPTVAAELLIGLKFDALIAEFNLSLLYGFIPIPNLSIGCAF